MPPASPVLDDDQLVPCARFGTALHRARLQSGVTLAALARTSEQRFLPDQLVSIERGAVALTDDDVVALTALYDLPERPWARSSMLDLVLDRASMSDLDVAAPRVAGPERSRSESLERLAVRFVALSILMGIDLTSGPVGLEVFADAAESSLDLAVNLLAMALERDADRIGRVISEMEHRVVVPQVGFLVGETAMGTLLMVGRSGPDDAASPLPPCGELADLLAASR